MIKIGTININGLLDTTKQKTLFQYCRDHKLMITFIQETHISTKEQMRHLNSNYGGKNFGLSAHPLVEGWALSSIPDSNSSF
jgi:exonuclease III